MGRPQRTSVLEVISFLLAIAVAAVMLSSFVMRREARSIASRMHSLSQTTTLLLLSMMAAIMILINLMAPAYAALLLFTFIVAALMTSISTPMTGLR